MHMSLTQTLVLYELLYPDAQVPVRATQKSAARDAFAYLKDRTQIRVYTQTNFLVPSDGPVLILQAGWRAAIPLGFKARVADGYGMLVLPRSGLSLTQDLGVANSPGLIDCDYPNEWAAIVVNRSKEPVVIQHNDRIAQLLLVQVPEDVWVPGAVTPTTDRVDGFGHTGR